MVVLEYRDMKLGVFLTQIAVAYVLVLAILGILVKLGIWQKLHFLLKALVITVPMVLVMPRISQWAMKRFS